jgi:hypothetical protein
MPINEAYKFRAKEVLLEGKIWRTTSLNPNIKLTYHRSSFEREDIILYSK